MNGNEIAEWCALSLGPCWSRGEWIAVWSSFGGVAVAFALGALSQVMAKSRDKKSAIRFLERTLLQSFEAISFFDNEYLKVGDEIQIGRAFGGLGHAAAAIKWAAAHPEKLEPDFFLSVLKVQDRVILGGRVGPSQFSGSNFALEASSHLHRTVVQVASDIRFLLRLP
jgi:hypothetical protein